MQRSETSIMFFFICFLYLVNKNCLLNKNCFPNIYLTTLNNLSAVKTEKESIIEKMLFAFFSYGYDFMIISYCQIERQ